MLLATVVPVVNCKKKREHFYLSVSDISNTNTKQYTGKDGGLGTSQCVLTVTVRKQDP
jgi:hypothetical protein